MTNVLIAKEASYHYPDRPEMVVRNLDFQLGRGEIIQLTGRNGSGKTTALKVLAGLLEPTSGEVRLAAGHRSIYMDQNAASMLAAGLTVEEHFKAFLRSDEKLMLELSDTLEQFGIGLGAARGRFVGQLSGGQAQILALLIAILGGHDVLLLDEFTAHLDPVSTEVAKDIVSKAVSVHGKSVALVAHINTGLHIDREIPIDINMSVLE